MLGRRPATVQGPDHRERSFRSVIPLLIAAVLFGLGAVGMLSVLPYSLGADSALLVTGPSRSPEAVASETLAPQAVREPGRSAEDIPLQLEPSPEPTFELPPVRAVAVPDQRIVELTPLPDPPTATPTPPLPAGSPTPTLTPAPNATPTPASGFIPDSREPGPVKQAEPVTAFFDNSFQQPDPVAPSTSDPGSPFPVSPGR